MKSKISFFGQRPKHTRTKVGAFAQRGIFGADEEDWATKFSLGPKNKWKLDVANDLNKNQAKQALVAFYALQKQRGYKPFRVINTFKISLNNVSLNAISK
jgi:hypothetical protein